MSTTPKPTFESGPAEVIDGEGHRLIYVRADRQSEPLDYRAIALQHAVATEQFTFRGRDERGEHRDPASDIISTAKLFLAFLEGGAA